MSGDRAQLAVGDEAWCLLLRQSGEARQTLGGAARVRVVAFDGDAYQVEILRASGGVEGHRLNKNRVDLYAVTGPEHAAFGAEVRRFWGDEARRSP